MTMKQGMISLEYVELTQSHVETNSAMINVKLNLNFDIRLNNVYIV